MENLPPMPVKRMSGAAVTLDDTIYIVGGVGGSQKMLVFDPTQLTWNEQPGPEQPREHTAAVPRRNLDNRRTLERLRRVEQC